jgi:DNA-binding LacI/PurR family transcriptional regulator
LTESNPFTRLDGMEKGRRTSKTKVLKDHLLTEMIEHRFPIGHRLPSEIELMKQFSVSRGTVQRALAELSAEGWIKRQQGRGTFRAGPEQRAKPKGASLIVGVWFNWPAGPMWAPAAEGIRRELRRWGYHAVFEEGGLGMGAERRGIDDLVHKHLDGFIVAPSGNPHDDHGPLEKLIDQKVPLVLVDQEMPGQDADLVTTDNELGGEEIVEHLIQLGHRRIGFVGVPGISTVEARHRGYRRAMQAHGLSIDDAWVQVTDEAAFDAGRRAAAEILALPGERRPTAVFGANDYTAHTCVVVARERGLKVPEDLSVAGFDGVERQAEFPIELTTYAQPRSRIGRHAARLLMCRIQMPSRPTVHLVLEGELTRRRSTAPPPGSGRA